MPTFKDQLGKLTRTKQEVAVWETLLEYLTENFVSRDGTPAKKGILADECIQPKVPEEVIEDIVDEITEKHLNILNSTIHDIETAEVKNAKKGTGKAPNKKAD